MPIVDEASLAALFIAAVLGTAEDGVRPSPDHPGGSRPAVLMTVKELPGGALELALVLPDQEVFAGVLALPDVPVPLPDGDAPAGSSAGSSLSGSSSPRDAAAMTGAGGSTAAAGPARTAALSGSRGATMSCRIRPAQAGAPLTSGGSGLCVVSDGRSLDVRF